MIMKRRPALLVCLIACLCCLLVGGVIVLLLTRPWLYTAHVREISVLPTEEGDLLKVALFEHPPWSQRCDHSYAVNRKTRTIDLLSTYVIWEPFASLPGSSEETVPDFTILIPAERLTPGSYAVRHFRNDQWTVIGTLQQDDQGRLTWEPRDIRGKKRSRRLLKLPGER